MVMPLAPLPLALGERPGWRGIRVQDIIPRLESGEGVARLSFPGGETEIIFRVVPRGVQLGRDVSSCMGLPPRNLELHV